MVRSGMRVELVATAIEPDDELAAHDGRVGDAERVWGQLGGEPGRHPGTRRQRVQLAAAAHTTGHAIHHDQRHAAASPRKVVAEAGGRHDGSTG